MPALRLIVCGVQGRMGSRVAALAQLDRRFRLVAGVVGHAMDPAPAFPLISERELRPRLTDADVVVDFSTAEASVRYAELAAKTQTPVVVGTTGRTPAQEEALRAFAKKSPIFVAPNFSPGMSLLLHLARAAVKALPDWDAGVIDLHHKEKKDSPSGTALRLAEAASGAGRRKPQVVSLREGGVVGDHTLLLAGPDERLEFVHRAESRDVFARGALEAALWLRGRKPGLYAMADMLGFK